MSSTHGGHGGPWDDADLIAQLARYEEVCRAAGMSQNAIHSYWDYARRFNSSRPMSPNRRTLDS